MACYISKITFPILVVGHTLMLLLYFDVLFVCFFNLLFLIFLLFFLSSYCCWFKKNQSLTLGVQSLAHFHFTGDLLPPAVFCSFSMHGLLLLQYFP